MGQRGAGCDPYHSMDAPSSNAIIAANLHDFNLVGSIQRLHAFCNESFPNVTMLTMEGLLMWSLLFQSPPRANLSYRTRLSHSRRALWKFSSVPSGVCTLWPFYLTYCLFCKWVCFTLKITEEKCCLSQLLKQNKSSVQTILLNRDFMQPALMTVITSNTSYIKLLSSSAQPYIPGKSLWSCTQYFTPCLVLCSIFMKYSLLTSWLSANKL